MGKIAAKKKWKPLVGSAKIQFQRPLGPFQSYRLISTILGWDEKWFFIEQRFESNGKVFARGIIKGLFRGPKSSIPPSTVLAALDYHEKSPGIPDEEGLR